MGGLPLPDVREQAASLNKPAPFQFSLPPPREQGLSKSTRGPPRGGPSPQRAVFFLIDKGQGLFSTNFLEGLEVMF